MVLVGTSIVVRYVVNERSNNYLSSEKMKKMLLAVCTLRGSITERKCFEEYNTISGVETYEKAPIQ